MKPSQDRRGETGAMDALHAGQVGKPARRRRGKRNQLAARKREDLLARIRRTPGLSIAQLQKEAGTQSRGPIRYHIEMLLKERLVFERKCGQHRLIFAPGTPEDVVLGVIKERLLDSGPARLLYETVCEHPGILGRELRARLGLAPTLFYYHLRRQVGAGLLEDRGEDAVVGGQDGRLHPGRLRLSHVGDAAEAGWSA